MTLTLDVVVAVIGLLTFFGGIIKYYDAKFTKLEKDVKEMINSHNHQNELDIGEIKTDIASIKYNYIKRFDDLKTSIFELKIELSDKMTEIIKLINNRNV